jgi:hypothetical protein
MRVNGLAQNPPVFHARLPIEMDEQGERRQRGTSIARR